MNYFVVYRKEGKPQSLLFTYRDEKDIAYSQDALIRNEDDVIRIMLKYFEPDNGDMVIKETLLNMESLREDKWLLPNLFLKLDKDVLTIFDKE